MPFSLVAGVDAFMLLIGAVFRLVVCVDGFRVAGV